MRQRLKKRLEQGYWKGLPLGKSETWSDKTEVANTDVCVVATLIGGNVQQLRKTVLLAHHHLTTNEPWLKFRTHVYVRNNRFSPEKYDNSSSELSVLFPKITRLRIFEESTRAYEIFDLALNNCDGSKYVIFLEEKWEAVYFTNVTLPKGYLYAAPLFTQAIDLMESENDLLEVWLGDTPRANKHYSNRTAWLRAKKRDFNGKVGASFYRKQFGNSWSPLGVTRVGGSLKMMSRLKTLPPFNSINSATYNSSQ